MAQLDLSDHELLRGQFILGETGEAVFHFIVVVDLRVGGNREKLRVLHAQPGLRDFFVSSIQRSMHEEDYVDQALVPGRLRQGKARGIIDRLEVLFEPLLLRIL